MKTKLLTWTLLLLSVAAGAQEAVDLGLSVKWATCNVGANVPEEAGLYFAWGDTMGYTSDTNDGHSFDWTTYKYCNGSANTMTKYCTQDTAGYNGFTDDKTVLEACDDAATSQWGSEWRMPTRSEWIELRTNCTWTPVQLHGMNGYHVSATNGNHIFLPAAGQRIDTDINRVGQRGYYWSASLCSPAPNTVFGLLFDSEDARYNGTYNRFRGLSIRPVLDNVNSTDINITDEQTSSVTKSIRNGQLIITRDNKKYNAQGIKLK